MIAARPAMAQEAPAAAQSAEAYLAEAQAAMDSMLANAEEFRAEGDCATVQAILETIQALIKSEREAHPEYPSSLFDALQAQLDGAAAPECPWSFGEPAEPDMALTLGDLGLQLVLDSEDWCEYGPAQPQGETPGDGPGGDPSRGSSPSSPGSTSRGSPPAMPELSDWDDLQQWIDETNAWLELQPDSVRNAVFSDWWESVRDPVADAEFAAAVSALRAASDNARNDDPADAPEDAGDPNDAPTVTLIVKATGAAQTGVGQAATGRQQVKLFADSVQNVALPSEGGDRPQTDAGADPLACTTDEEGQCEIDYALDNFDALIAGMDEAFADAFVDGLSDAIEAIVNPSEVTSYTLEVAAGTPISVVLQPYTISTLTVGDSTFVTLMAPTGEVEAGWIQTMAGYQVGVIGIEVNICRDKQPGPPPPDPLMQGAGSW
ncbi:hypothetical protein, partial [uncultured Brevundimonas sp.]|uniref:hypothetical protein n=1 Tax=uncultured Brevundimonas sp. TaxID=213418 RepID=UPI0026273638